MLDSQSNLYKNNNNQNNTSKIKEIPYSIIKLLFSTTPEKKSNGVKELDTFLKTQVDNFDEDVIEKIIKSYKQQSFDKIDFQNNNAKKGTFSGLQIIINHFNQVEKTKHSSLVLLVQMLIGLLKGSYNDNRFVSEITICLDKFLKTQSQLVLSCFSDILSVVLFLQSNSPIELSQLVFNLDETLKDFISQANIKGEMDNFNYNRFYDVVENGLFMYSPLTKITIVNWIIFIDTAIEKKVIYEFDRIIPGVFPMLNESNKEVVYSAEQLIKNMSLDYETKFENLDPQVNYNIINAIVSQSVIHGDRSKLNALEFLELYLNKTLDKFRKMYDNNNVADNNDDEEKINKYNTGNLLKSTKKKEIDDNDSNKKNNIDEDDDDNDQKTNNIFNQRQSAKNLNTFKFKKSSTNTNEVIEKIENTNNKKSESKDNNEKTNTRLQGLDLLHLPQNTTLPQDFFSHTEITDFQQIHYFLLGKILNTILYNVRSEIEAISEKAFKCNELLKHLFNFYTNPELTNFEEFESILRDYLNSNKSEELALEIVLKWTKKLSIKFHAEFINTYRK